jgi:hypothetical protein
MHRYRFAAGFTLALGLALGLGACDDTILPAPIFPNTVDTVSLAALDGTPVATHSAYNIASRSTVRTDITTAFDFVFNIDTLGRAVLLPATALRIAGNAGLQRTTSTFAELRIAPGGTYVTDSAVAVLPGDVVAVRSRLVSCELGALYYYAKLGVIAVDAGGRRITFEILGNTNCGYRSLEPGLPTQ